MRISFIGGGVIGEAMVGSVLAKGVATNQEIIVSDISRERRDLLTKKYQVKTTSNNVEAARGAEVIVLAVKPQDLAGVLNELREVPPTDKEREKAIALNLELKKGLEQGQLALSIVAGATLGTLCRGLNHSSVVRAMPNMPAQVGEGITIWTATSEVTQEQKELTRSLLAALGREIYVDNEKYIDMATAVSGSGPAYVFVIIEALIDAGVHIGLPRGIAEKLVLETILGSVRAIQLTAKHPAELRNLVTSPGGTTVEGLLQLEKGGMRSLLLQAVIAAYEKAKTLKTTEGI